LYVVEGILFEMKEMGGACMGRGAVYTGLYWGNRKERDHLDDTGIDGRIILDWIFRKWNGWGSG
jgi:hypothetical protein